MATTLIRNGLLIDGRGDDPVEDGAVLLVDEVGRSAEVRAPAGEVRTVDAEGGAILPGMIDCHVHLALERIDLLGEMATPFSFPFYRAIGLMRRTLDAGVTSVRDAGGADLGMKRAVEAGLVAGPRMQISVTILSTTGGHVDFWLPSGTSAPIFSPHPGRPDGICDGVEEVRKKVREVLRAGADVIKVCSTGGVMSPTDHPEFTQFGPDELAVMVEEGAYRRGTPVMAHAQGTEGIVNAVRAGVRSIEHGIYLDDEAIELMVERGTFLVPTLAAPVGVLEAAEAGGAIPEWGLKKSREVIEAHRDSIARAHAAGVRIAMGTDVPVTPHGSNLRELELMVGVGMSPMDAIVASTREAAACLGWDDELGTLEPGKLGDVVVAGCDPLDDIAALADPDAIRWVFQGGEAVKGG